MRQVPATLTSLSLAIAPMAALAQQAAPPPPAGAASAPDSGTAGEPEVQRVTITTGTRSAKAVDKIPGAITVVSKEELQRTLLLTEDATAVLARTVPGYDESSQAMSNTGETLR